MPAPQTLADASLAPDQSTGRTGGHASVLRRAAQQFARDHLADQAGALTYYGVLAIFPMLIVLISVLGLIGSTVTQPLIHTIRTVAPGPARTVLTSAIDNIQSRDEHAGVLLLAGLLGAFTSSSGYVGVFMRASNIIWKVERPDRSSGRCRSGSRSR